MATTRLLARLTQEFYELTADSFAETRQSPWRGWHRALAEMEGAAGGLWPPAIECLRVLDLACGNARFERFLADEFLRRPVATGGACRRMIAYGVDSCDALARTEPIEGVEMRYTHLDVVTELLEGRGLADRLGRGAYDLAVCFGFMHHLPLPEHRAQVLDALACGVVPGGFVVVSFWQPSQSPRLLAKALRTTQDISERYGLRGFGPHDYLLGWQDRADVVRFCHECADGEIDALVSAVAPRAREIARYSADGKEGTLNRYLILQVRGEAPARGMQ